MMSTRTLTYYIATTLDGFIAHTDESHAGFLSDGHHITEYLHSLRDFDTVLMGRRTFEIGYAYGAPVMQPSPTYAHMMQYVFSRTMPDSTHPRLSIVRDDPVPFTRDLKSQTGGAIYLCGGGQLARALVTAGLVDDLIIKVNPVLFGQGIPLFSPFDQTIPLHLLDTKVYAHGVVFLRYHVGV